MKKCMLICFVLMVFFASSAFSVLAEEQTDAANAAKREDIKKLLALTGAGNLGVQVMEQLIPSYKKALPQIPVEFWNEFSAEVNTDDLVNLIIPIYDKHVSHADIKELIKFYESPLGKRFIEIQPVLLRESMVVGQKWGQQLGQKIMQKLQEKGYK